MSELKLIDKEKHDALTFPIHLPVVKSGFLQKKGGERRNWKTRWFVLKKAYLGYFKKPLDPTPKGAIHLAGVAVGVSTRKANCFAIRTALRTYFLCAQNKAEQDLWMAAIEESIHYDGITPIPILAPSFDDNLSSPHPTRASHTRTIQYSMSTIALPSASPVATKEVDKGPNQEVTQEPNKEMQPSVSARGTFLTYHRARPSSMIQNGTLNFRSQPTSPISSPLSASPPTPPLFRQVPSQMLPNQKNEPDVEDEKTIRELTETIDSSLDGVTNLQRLLLEITEKQEENVGHDDLKKALALTKLLANSLSRQRVPPKISTSSPQKTDETLDVAKESESQQLQGEEHDNKPCSRKIEEKMRPPDEENREVVPKDEQETLTTPAKTRDQFFKENDHLIIICQGQVRKWLANRPKTVVAADPDPKETKQQKKRANLIAELLATEKSYVSSLKLLVEKFSEPLNSIMKKFPNNNLGVTTENLKQIFANIEAILEFNTTLLDQLEAEPSQVGKIFQSWARAQDLYKEYCSNYNVSITTLEQMKQNAAFEKFIKQCENNAGTGLTLSSFLIMPVQRIPRYVMLLEELVHNTPRAEAKSLSTSLATMKEIADAINEAKRKVDSMEKMTHIRQSISGIDPDLENNIFNAKLLGSSRVFMREAEFTRLLDFEEGKSVDRNNTTQPVDGPKHQIVQLFLFNDMIIITVPDKKKSSFFNDSKKRPYSFVSLIEIEKIKTVQDTHSIVSTFLNSSHLLEVSTELDKFLFSTNNKFQRDDWFKELKKLLPSNIRKQKYKVLKFH
eukprot:TRINITY_DN3458_c0_g1_i1.p1 TRINITY_DN3458_c0_g1~~TRINITY_DN3458_c0_g1_i1.p1  ORF type:complete len:790 (+),score=163.65 TRINITY_DN3458_c0_g1_i1:19-2388(+)